MSSADVDAQGRITLDSPEMFNVALTWLARNGVQALATTHDTTGTRQLMLTNLVGEFVTAYPNDTVECYGYGLFDVVRSRPRA